MNKNMNRELDKQEKNKKYIPNDYTKVYVNGQTGKTIVRTNITLKECAAYMDWLGFNLGWQCFLYRVLMFHVNSCNPIPRDNLAALQKMASCGMSKHTIPDPHCRKK